MPITLRGTRNGFSLTHIGRLSSRMKGKCLKRQTLPLTNITRQ